jgi:hypothetical protein
MMNDYKDKSIKNDDVKSKNVETKKIVQDFYFPIQKITIKAADMKEALISLQNYKNSNK